MAKAPIDIRSLARVHTEMCIRALSSIASHCESPSARVAAATALLDRGWGKPEQSIDVRDNRELRQFTDAELLAIINGQVIEHDEAIALPAPDSELH